MKYYPCIIVGRDELAQAGIGPIEFDETGRLADVSAAKAIEDYCGRPVVSVRESTRADGELLVLAADGYVQYNRISGKRSVVLMGDYDTLRVVLADIFAERPGENPYDVFCEYAYQTDINVQLEIKEWVLSAYGV